MNASITRFYSVLHNNAVMIELTLLLLSLISLLLYYSDIPNSDLVLVRSVNLVAIVYFFLACFDPFEAKDQQTSLVIPKLITIGFTLAVLGAFFKLMNYPGQEMLLHVGAVSMPVAALIGGFNSRRNWSIHLVVIRITLIIILALVLWFF